MSKRKKKLLTNSLKIPVKDIVSAIRKEMPPTSKVLIDKRTKAKHDVVGRRSKHKERNILA